MNRPVGTDHQTKAALALVKEMLEKGPMPMYGVYAAARGKGIGDRTLQRAANQLGVKRTIGEPSEYPIRASGHRQTLWSL